MTAGTLFARLTPRRILVGLGIVVLLALATFVYEAWRAGSALVHVRSEGRTLTSQLNQGDLVGAGMTARQLRDSTGSARSATDGPLWDIGKHLPFLGDDIGAVQTSADVLDAISTHSLPTLLSLARDVEHGPLRPRHGRVDLAAVRALRPTVDTAAAGVDGPAARMAAIRPQHLLYPVNELIGELRGRVADAKAAIDATRGAFQVLPGMLGANGPKTYLLLVQNNAEIRSTGGMPGSWAVLHARDGRLTMGRQGDASLFASTRRAIPLTPEEKALFGDQLGTDPRDITFTPDFPRTAQMARALGLRKGVHADGVFAVDPVALSYVLAGTGPVHVGQVQMDFANAVPLLLNTIYRTVNDPTAQNAFYAAAARRTFNALVSGQGDQVRAIRGLVIAASQRRVLAWSAEPAVAKVIGDNKLSGAMPRAGSDPQVGLFLNDGVAGKMEYYLRYSAAVDAQSCDDSGVQHLTFTTTLRSTAPAEVVNYPIWVTGTGQFAPPGDILMSMGIYGPWHGRITRLTVDGRPATITDNQLDGHQVATLPVELRPGQAMQVSATMVTGPGQDGDVDVTTTPGMELVKNPASFDSAC